MSIRRLVAFTSFLSAWLLPALVLAAPAAESVSSTERGTYAIAMGIGMGIAALGGGMGQGRAAAAALEGICRNPTAVDKVFTPMLLALSFIESLVIFVFVVAFLLYGKMG